MKFNIDARGLACPQPVILVRNGMKDNSEIEILVDNETAIENIKRLAETTCWKFNYIKTADFYTITIISPDSDKSNSTDQNAVADNINNTVVVFSSDKMGSGDDDLGSLLIKACINTITSLDTLPSKIIFYNTGVKLTAEGSGVIDDIEFLQSKGTEILICGTCLNYFNIKDKVKTGIISNMFDIMTALNNAGRIINP